MPSEQERERTSRAEIWKAFFGFYTVVMVLAFVALVTILDSLTVLGWVAYYTIPIGLTVLIIEGGIWLGNSVRRRWADTR